MSVSRDIIANALEIPEERVRCDNCAGADRWINEAYICKAWGDQMTYADAFCTFFVEKEREE